MKNLILISFALLITSVGFSQKREPVKWEYKINMLNNCEAELIFTATIDTGWHLYSQKFELNPLFFEFAKPSGYTIIGNVSEPVPFKGYDDLLKSDVYYFRETEVIFKQKIKLTNANLTNIVGKIYGQVCQTHEGVCMIIQQDFSFEKLKCQ